MRKLIDRFPAQDAAGNRHIVLIYQDFIDVTTKTEAGYMAGTKTAFLSDGRALSRVDDLTYRIISSGDILKKVG